LKKNNRFAHSSNLKTKNMKKLFAVIALAGVMVSCGNKKKEEKTAGKDTTVTNTTNTTGDQTTTTTTTNTAGVPTFSDPEVQKFANDYAAFVTDYKNGLKDPAKLAELTKSMQDWSSRSQSIGMKLASNPEEAKKWTDWVMVISKELTDAAMNMGK
jgi:hypothetical protein